MACAWRDSTATGFDGLRFRHWQAEAPRRRRAGAVLRPRRRTGQRVLAGRADRAGRRCWSASRIEPPKGAGDPLGQGQRLHRRRRHQGVPGVRRARAPSTTRSAAASRCSRRWPTCPAPPSPRSTASAWAAAPRSALACRYRVASERRLHPHRPARSEARHLPGLGRQRAPAAPGRRTGGDGHDADRPRAVGERPRARSGLVDKVVRTGAAGRRRRRAGAARHAAPVQAARAGLGRRNTLAGAQAAGADDGQAGRAQGAARSTTRRRTR